MATSTENVGWGIYVCEGSPFYMAATAKGVCYITLGNESQEEFCRWIRKHVPACRIVQDKQAVESGLTQLDEYFQGKRREFSLELDLRGTEFQIRVWQALQTIPYGETCAYSDIAKQIGRPNAVRAVGGAIGANPLSILVPCHRVVGKNGTLTGYNGGLELKTKLLQLEALHSADVRGRLLHPL